MKESDIPTKLLWIDLEMTGLDPAKQRIIEVAAVVTDFGFNELGRYEAIINHEELVLEAAEDWPKEHMHALFNEVRAAEQNEAEVTAALSEFIREHFGEERAVLAGNSIHQDRRFIRQWWSDIEKLLHYRMLDVSSYKIWIQATTDQEYTKKETHRALDDILESIEELKWSLEIMKEQ